jgi:hypothetical protein
MTEQEALARMVAPGTKRPGQRELFPDRYHRSDYLNTAVTANNMEGLLARFETKFTKTNDGSCWLWHANKFSCGYGQFKVCRSPQNAHRVSWRLYRGMIPASLWVLHECDVRACVNPNHLFLGTSKNNNEDMVHKGRARPAKGEDSGSAVLTEKLVRWVRSVYTPRHPVYGGSALARQLGVQQQTISKIVLGRRWEHLQ